MAQEEIREFRYLRQRLDRLRRESAANREMLDSVDWGKVAGRDNSADLQRLHLVDDVIEGEISDGEYLLDYYKRTVFQSLKMTIQPSTLVLAAAIVLGVFMALLAVGIIASGAFRVG